MAGRYSEDDRFERFERDDERGYRYTGPGRRGPGAGRDFGDYGRRPGAGGYEQGEEYEDERAYGRDYGASSGGFGREDDYGGGGRYGRNTARDYGHGRLGGGRYEDDYAAGHERADYARREEYERDRGRGRETDYGRTGSRFYGSKLDRDYADYGGRAAYGGERSRAGRDFDDDDDDDDRRERRRSASRGRVPRGLWDRISDEVASWFGDEGAERRRRLDERGVNEYEGRRRARKVNEYEGQHRGVNEYEGQHRGRGPRGYRRSDERIREDINDRLTDEDYLDASDVTVEVVAGEVMLTGTVDSRRSKRLAEEIAESVSGVSNVENRIRVRRALGATAGDAGAQTATDLPAGTEGITPGTADATSTDTTTDAERSRSRSA